MVITDEATGIELCIHPTILVPTTHTVFNYDQTEGIDLSSLKSLVRPETNKIEACGSVIKEIPRSNLFTLLNNKISEGNVMNGFLIYLI